MNENTEKSNVIEEQQKDIIEIEDYVKAGKEIPNGASYRIRIDKNHYTIDSPIITGRQLLKLAKKEPVEQFQVFQKLKGGASIEIPYNSVVDLTEAGIERFYTLALDQTEGA